MHVDMIPLEKKKKVNNRLIKKRHEDFDEKDKIVISKNAKAKNYWIYGLDINIYNNVDQASYAHEM